MEKKIKVKNCDKDENLNGAIIIYEIMPGRPTKYVTQQQLQDAVVSIRKDMVTHEELQEAVASIRKDMVSEERLQEVVHQVVDEAVVSIKKDMVTHEELHEVVNNAIDGLEKRITKLILSLKNK
jgi:arsenate reductase-like glutaredoxin family protein